MARFKVTDKIITNIKPGDMAKVETNGERFWVKVCRIYEHKKTSSRDKFTVVVKNDLINSKLKYNEKIHVLRKNIFEIL